MGNGLRFQDLEYHGGKSNKNQYHLCLPSTLNVEETVFIETHTH